MTRGVSWFFVAPLVLLGLSACQFSLFEQREPWRSEAEERCLAEGLVKSSAYITRLREVDGAGTCGMDHPLKIAAFAEGQVAVAPNATLACPATASVERWLDGSIQPAAMAWFGQPVVKIKQMSSYSCRNMNGAKTGKISEHAFGNALDIGGFVLADGREVMVKTGWKGQPDEQGFLRTVHATACEQFSTVLGPGSNVYHYDHIHVDLMRRQSTRVVCEPSPRVPTPPNGPMVAMPGMQQMPPQTAPQAMPPAEAGMAPAPGEAPMPEDSGQPLVISPPADGNYNHGVDPNYQPQPAGYPVPANTAPPAPEPANNYPPPAASPQQAPRPGLPLPPAAVPMVKWQKGADPLVTGSVKAQSYAPEAPRAFPPMPRLAAPIEPPRAIPGED
ncbi:extensin family protein [Bosea sp. 117]|uniref:extensin-like domain-containing protein n=1 Tax=Bosea sp. 117 TaxID=1125973 RepID=UPI00068D19A5|nr:extensin family protein [Bosea sp. 117]